MNEMGWIKELKWIENEWNQLNETNEIVLKWTERNEYIELL